MSLALRVTGLLVLGGVVASVGWLVGADTTISDLAIIAAALAAGELVVLRPADRVPLPLSFAVVTVLVVATTPAQFIGVVVAAEAVAMLLLVEPLGASDRVMRFAERCAEAFAAGAVYQAVDAIHPWNSRATTLAALAAAAIVPIVVADLVTYIREQHIASIRGRGADITIVSSGILMAVGYEGIAGKGQLGLLGPILFSIPLLAAWYSFELLASTRRSYLQTVGALAAAPELGGLVREGHAARAADMAVAMGRVLVLTPAELEHLETAAQLHHLGAVCLDEPRAGMQLDPHEVAAAGALMLRASDALAPAGDVVAAEPLLHRPPSGVHEQSPAALSGMILKVASAYDELTEGDDEHAAWAVEALYTGPGYVYDGRVLDALERVLERRGVLLPVR